MREADKAALERQRERDRAQAVEDVRVLAAFVADAQRRGLIQGRTRLADDPVVPGGRLWLMIVLAEDHRAIFHSCLAGEYESVTAAGRDAGLARAMPRRRVELGKDLKRTVRAIFSALDEDEWLAFATELAGLEEEREKKRNPPRRRRRQMFERGKWNPNPRVRPISGSRII